MVAIAAAEGGHEGVVAKRADVSYRDGDRSLADDRSAVIGKDAVERLVVSHILIAIEFADELTVRLAARGHRIKIAHWAARVPSSRG